MYEIDITFIGPKIGGGRLKNSLATNNNVPTWFRYYKKKIKDSFKTMLCEWYLPKSDKLYERAEVTFTILRNNNKKMDPDAFGISAYKWAIDLLVEQGYLEDDDKIRIILEPTQLGCKDISETVINMKVKFYDLVVK